MDGRVVPASEATVPLLDDGFLRGDAVFETILVRHGRTHALDRHLARMRRSAKTTGVRLPVLRHVVGDLLAAWGERDGALKLVVTRSGLVRGLLSQPVWPEALALVAVEVPWRTALSGTKTLSYAMNQWVTRHAQELHGDDAVITVDGIVHELSTAAIVWVRDGTLHAPDHRELPVLESVTLRELSDITDVDLGVYPIEHLRGADEVFVLSATRPLLPVHALDDVAFIVPGPVTTELRQRFAEHIEDTLDPRP
jgi:branched-chain amino acid aminotransferase